MNALYSARYDGDKMKLFRATGLYSGFNEIIHRLPVIRGEKDKSNFIIKTEFENDVDIIRTEFILNPDFHLIAINNNLEMVLYRNPLLVDVTTFMYMLLIGMTGTEIYKGSIRGGTEYLKKHNIYDYQFNSRLARQHYPLDKIKK